MPLPMVHAHNAPLAACTPLMVPVSAPAGVQVTPLSNDE